MKIRLFVLTLAVFVLLGALSHETNILITGASRSAYANPSTFAAPSRMAVGDTGVVVLDGRKLVDERGAVVADLAAGRAALAPWGLEDDAVTFKPYSLVHQNNAFYASGFMLDRLHDPKKIPAASPGEYFVRLGQVYYVAFEITDEFRPILVEPSGVWELPGYAFETAFYGLAPSQYEQILLNYVWGAGPNSPRAPPNLVPTKDGAFLVAKNTVYQTREPVNPIFHRMNPQRFPLEWRNVTHPHNHFMVPPGGLYKLWPDGRQELLHHSKWYTEEMVLTRGEPVSIPIKVLHNWTPRIVAARFFPTKDPNIVLCTGVHDVQRLDLRTHEYVNWSEPILWGSPLLGDELRQYVEGGFYPALIFTTDRPFQAADGHVYFLTEAGLWRLYDFKYTQDLLRWKDPKIAAALDNIAADDIVDWAISRDMKTLHLLSGTRKRLYSIPMPTLPPLTKQEPLSKVEFFEPIEPFWLRPNFFN